MLYESAAQFNIFPGGNTPQCNSRNVSTLMPPLQTATAAGPSSSMLDQPPRPSEQLQLISTSPNSSGLAQPMGQNGDATTQLSQLAQNAQMTQLAQMTSAAAQVAQMAQNTNGCNTSLHLNTIQTLRLEFERCLENYRAKRMMVTKLQEDGCNLKKDLTEAKKRLEKGDLLIKELKV